MNRSALLSFTLAVGLHMAVLLGLPGPAPRPKVKPVPDDWLEVALYSPPPALWSAKESPTPEDTLHDAVPEKPVPPPLVPEEPPPDPAPPPVKSEPSLPSEPETPATVKTPNPRKPQLPARPATNPKPARAASAARSAPHQDKPPAPSAGDKSAAGGYQSVGNVQYVRHGSASYPAGALRKKQAGTTVLMLYINESGRVDRVEVVSSSGFPSLDRAAAVAEKNSVFRPVRANCKPMKVRARVPYTFRLQ